MGTIATHITTLIHLYDCVIVPGLGAFVGNVKPAEVITEKGLFLPPKKELGFNRSLQHNDGLLCDFVARREGISFAEAQREVESFVLQTLESLANRQVVVIGDVGELKKDAMGNILFWPNGTSLFLPESFGLSPFHMNVSQTLSIRPNQPNHEAAQIWLRRVSQRKWVAGVALFVGLFLLTTELQTPDSVNMGSIIPSITVSTPENSDETTTQDVEGVSQESAALSMDTTAALITAEQTTHVSQPELAVATNSTTEKVLFYLVVASFPEKTAAEKYKEKMVDNGYNATEVLSIGGKNRVAIDRFTSRADAFAALENYRQIKGFESVWLLKNTK